MRASLRRRLPDADLMPSFAYTAVNRSGAIDAGTVEAADERTAQRLLRGRGLTPVSLKPALASAIPSATVSSAGSAKAAPAVTGQLWSRGSESVDRKDVLRFTSELAVLLRAGLPLDRAIKVQIESAAEGAVKQMLSDLLDALKGGKALSVGLSARPDVFDGFFISMVRSGEASGGLAAVLTDMAAYLERSRALRASVVSALVYPAILAVVALLSITLMLGFVVPEFEALFDDMGDALPLMTEMVIALGDLIAAWGWLLLIFAVTGTLLLRRWLSTAEGQSWRDHRSVELPVLGSIFLRYEVAQFSRTLGTLLTNGVALLNAADIAIGTVRNLKVRQSLAGIAPTIKRGGRLSEAMDLAVFSPVALQMVRVGEESGSLDSMLLQLATVYETEVEAEIKRALALLEPLLILGMGGVIAIIIIAILMGILSVNQLAV